MDLKTKILSSFLRQDQCMLLSAVLLAESRIDQESMNDIVLCARNVVITSVLVNGLGQRSLSGSRT